MTFQKSPGENSSVVDSSAWDQIWKRESHSYVSHQRDRARSKIEAAIKEGLEFGKSDRVLDLGCGSGHVLIEAAQRISSASRLIACDLSPAAVSLALTNFRARGLDVEVLCADAAMLPLREESVHTVLLLMTLQHVYDEVSVLREVDRVLAQHGQLFVVVPNERSIISMSYKLQRFVTPVPVERRTFSLRRLATLVSSRFKIETCQVKQVGSDRWLSRAIDQTLAYVIPEWGRYIMLRCRKSVAN
jgi:ubiquinone/menaquinone biosynthesis C-methylase UbiE